MQERMKVLLIVNPAAGQLKAKTGLMDIVKRMNALGCLVTVVTTQRRAQASELVKELRGDYDRLVCCGGDGTLNEVISGLMQTEGKRNSDIYRQGRRMISRPDSVWRRTWERRRKRRSAGCPMNWIWGPSTDDISPTWLPLACFLRLPIQPRRR